MISAKVKDVDLHVGDTVRVHTTVVEGSKTRIQVFEGILISLAGRGENAMMKVRRIGAGQIGVERQWPLDAKSLVKVEVKRKAGNVRRSKLYYLRDLVGKKAVRV
ncbi:50S ribosomal protein L19 [Candidatus Daviesbacteria bacterium]|nr:50S ribosomal protein L19 [Candidatus Daviesbacteria bacterium]